MRYLVLRVCERLDPRALYGRSWNELQWHEQVELIAYEVHRREEESPKEE